MEFLATYGLFGLFVAAFLAATILPLSSEALLLIIIAHSDQFIIPVLVASIGNVLGSQFNYFLGYKGDYLLLKRVLRLSDEQITKARYRFQKYGAPSLLLAWLPVVGDPLTVVAGLFRVHFLLFTLLVAIGKSSRYILLAWGYQIF
jgi:membrane protein YqaA with SNARE-associated domain